MHERTIRCLMCVGAVSLMCVCVKTTSEVCREFSDVRCLLQADAVIAHVTDAAGAIRRTSVKLVSALPQSHLKLMWCNVLLSQYKIKNSFLLPFTDITCMCSFTSLQIRPTKVHIRCWVNQKTFALQIRGGSTWTNIILWAGKLFHNNSLYWKLNFPFVYGAKL